MTLPEPGEQNSETDFDQLSNNLRGLLAREWDWIANCANFAALIYHGMSDLNWAGLYLRQGDELVLGPFQGKTACVRIPLGRGVCGTAASTGQTQRVDDVHSFPGHIACDVDSRSELVVPLMVAGELRGVLDLDSPLPARFGARDQMGIERLCREFCSHHEV